MSFIYLISPEHIDEILSLADEIHTATQTIGYDYGNPAVAAKASKIKEIIKKNTSTID